MAVYRFLSHSISGKVTSRPPAHEHHEYWRRESQYRYEDRIGDELQGIKEELKSISTRITLLMGAVALFAFLIPILAPFIRAFLNVP